MQNWFTQGKISSQIYVFLPLKHHSCIQEATEEKLVDVWAVDSLQMWRETQTLETGEGRFLLPIKSKDVKKERAA